MLPFLKSKEDGSVGSESEPIQRKHDEDYDFLEGIGEDLCHAIEKKDYKAIGEALRAAFEQMEAEPHEEGEHI